MRPLKIEELESRLAPSGVQPTAFEQSMLEQLNDIRANPAAYGQTIGVNLSSVAATPPLAFDPNLIAAAQQHSQDMSTYDYFGHTDSSGLNPSQRIAGQGYGAAPNSVGEVILAGATSAAFALQDLISDIGVPNLSDRLQLLGVGLNNQQTEIGIGIVSGGTGPYSNYYTLDFATPATGGVFLTGVVYNEQPGTGNYAVGEGIGGLEISAINNNGVTVASTSNFTSGGYTLQVPPGVYTVTASGASMSPIRQVVTVSNQNTRLQFIEQLTNNVVAFLKQSYQDVLGRSISQIEINNWLIYLQQPGTTLASVANSIVTSPECLQKQWSAFILSTYQTYLKRTPDASEISSWLTNMESGLSETGLVAAIATSAEFQANYGMTDSQFVANLYIAMLNRTPSTQEINGWVGQLSNGMSRNQVVQAFLNSVEYATDQSTAWANQLYRSLLGRQPSAQEIANVVNSGQSYVMLENTILDSQEYYNRALSIQSITIGR